jgi:hypothetical protein
MFVIHHSGHGKAPIRNRRAIKTQFGRDKREKKNWYFCRPAAKFTIVGEIWVSYNPLEKEVRDE